MSEQKEDKQEFRVVDKRRFTSEGEVKAGAPDTPERGNTMENVAPKPQTAPKPAEPKVTPQSRPTPRDPRPDEERFDFSSLVISLATQALVMMGEVPNPESRGMNINLDAAKQTIDILILLEEKTRGNLTSEEQRLLTEVLSNLQLTYVNKVGKR